MKNKFDKEKINNILKIKLTNKFKKYFIQNPTLNYNKLIFFDIETTGLYYNDGAEITEISYFIYNFETNTFNNKRFLNSDINYIPEKIVELTGITINKCTKYGIPLKEILMNISKDFSNNILVAYNISFDLNFINFYLEKNNFNKLNNCLIDPLVYAQNKLYFLKKHTLENIAKHFNIKNNHHRAENDVKTLIEIFDKMILN